MPTAVQLSLPVDDARSVRILPDNVQSSSNLAESSDLKSVNETVEVQGNAKTTSTSSSHDELWKSSYNKLVEFKDREGHCRVPREHVEGVMNLGKWVSNQRLRLGKLKDDQTPSTATTRVALNHKIAQEKIDKLNKIGFVWDCYKGNSSKTNAISSSCSKELTSTKSSTSSAVAIGNNVEYTAMDDPNTNSKKSVRK